MLIIIKENKYNEYRKAKKKPSIFCKEILKIKNLKREVFYSKYFSDVEVLLSIIKTEE